MNSNKKKNALAYAGIYINENEFLNLQTDKLLVCFKYINDVFFLWTHIEKNFWERDSSVNNLTSTLDILPVENVSLFVIWACIYQKVNLL